MTENEIAWDLTEIFSGHDDPKITERMDNLSKKAIEFINDYKGQINSSKFTAEKLLGLFKKREDFSAEIGELSLYKNRLYSANMTISESEALKNRIEDFSTKLSKDLAFLDLDIAKYVNDNKSLINDPNFSNYKHILEKIQRAYPHNLSEIEEQLILEKDQYGVRAWSNLQSKWLNTRKIIVIVEGQDQELSYGEANALLTHPDRDTRISANKSIYGLLGKEECVFSSSLRSVCGDWVNNSKRRKYDSPMHDSLLVNDTTQEIIDNLMNSIENGVGVYRKYLDIKAKILKLPKLNCADVKAPLPIAPHKNYSWEQAKELAIQAYDKFDPEFSDIVKDMFNRNHIDASPRDGKRNGANCAAWYKGKSAYILMTYTGELNEIFTLIHELGHAIHDYLAIEAQTHSNFHPGYTVAEVASTFGELLVTDLLLETSESKEEKMGILAHVLDDAGQAAFQVSARVWFEQDLYKAIENGENLDGETISKYWCAGRDKMYGDSVEWFDEMNWEWTMKPHYYIPNFRFYNYPYVYAQLFVYALYQTYKEEGKDFVPKFKKLLAAGGSVSPEELGNIVGLDITKQDFWDLGIKQYEDFTNQLESLSKK
ncbi:MAG: M3 family oligoendopeptidase [Candidatus Lokiarchaeota archaeon]|nr:M3 family oligoendopeptidase [Candidatus Lokiarchaeota archaeon]